MSYYDIVQIVQYYDDVPPEARCQIEKLEYSSKFLAEKEAKVQHRTAVTGISKR